MKRPDLHPEADSEISDALFYYRLHVSLEIALELNEKIEAALLEIGRNLECYSRWPRTQARKYVLPRFPYLIIYLNEPERVYILAVAHTSRRPGYWKKRIAVD